MTDYDMEAFVPCKHCATAFTQMHELVTQLEELVYVDHLTGLYNKRSANEVLAQAIARTNRSRGILSLALLDLDHFKNINDTYGHYVGDRVLHELGDLLRKKCRSTDHIARIGGEEFSIILPDTNLNSAAVYLERLRKVIETELALSINDTTVRVTASIGIVEYVHDERMRKFFARADAALYIAKNLGRNRVVSSPISTL